MIQFCDFYTNFWHIKMLHCDAHPIKIGYLGIELWAIYQRPKRFELFLLSEGGGYMEQTPRERHKIPNSPVLQDELNNLGY